MEKIKKYLLKLSRGEREKLENIIAQIVDGTFDDLDVKKLKGQVDIYRVRAGSSRVIFKKTDKDSFILDVSRRNDSTYKKL
jgi:mRNA-degrading endonuclease RelE of RelBE toxin-antitoxin system